MRVAMVGLDRVMAILDAADRASRSGRTEPTFP